MLYKSLLVGLYWQVIHLSMLLVPVAHAYGIAQEFMRNEGKYVAAKTLMEIGMKMYENIGMK